MKKFLIILPIAAVEKEPLLYGEIYTEKDMRPYIEVLPPFQTTDEAEELEKKLSVIANKHTWFRDIITCGESENKERLVSKSWKLERLHEDLLESIPIVGNSDWNCETFKPTIKYDSSQGNKYTCYNLVLLKWHEEQGVEKYEVVTKTTLPREVVA